MEGEEKVSVEGEDRSDEGRASLSRSELRWERSRPLRSDFEVWLDVWNAELSRSVGVVWREEDAKEETEEARLGVLPRTDGTEVANVDGC